MEDTIVHFAVRKCPFLHGVAASQGSSAAVNLAINPLVPVSIMAQADRPLHMDLEDFGHTFQLFHGPNGVLPLKAFGPAPRCDSASANPFRESATQCPFRAHQASGVQTASGCPFGHQADSSSASVEAVSEATFRARGCNPPASPPLSAAPLPLASLSLGAGFLDFHNFFRPKPKPQPRKLDSGPPSSKAKGPTNRAPGTAGSTSASTSGPSSLSGGNVPSGGSFSSPGAGSVGPLSGSAQTAGACPLRKWLGPFAGLVFDKHGHITCPEPILRARAFLAATKPIRQLRPQALPVKFLAIGLTTAVLNVPCGMTREHTDKFSVGWFFAVHATIPFIAMIRKAVIMPKYAIIFTIASAIAGQQMGAKFERQRMVEQAPAALPAGSSPAVSATRIVVGGANEISSSSSGGRRSRTSDSGPGHYNAAFASTSGRPMASMTLSGSSSSTSPSLSLLSSSVAAAANDFFSMAGRELQALMLAAEAHGPMGEIPMMWDSTQPLALPAPGGCSMVGADAPLSRLVEGKGAGPGEPAC